MSGTPTALFNTVNLVRHPVPGVLERVPLDQLELAPNHRNAIDREAIHRLAHMLAATGQLTPCIGRRDRTTVAIEIRTTASTTTRAIVRAGKP